jgi:hypothetical protein
MTHSQRRFSMNSIALDDAKVAPSDLQVVHVFAKNTREDVVSYLAPYRGRMLAHIGVLTENKDDEIVPTKKGIAVSVEDRPKLAQAVQALIAAAGGEAR